mmetsp:Transcript_34249/g.55060  ORF Transcript_34249/g.55060 Transcript_34249/m.55060 type:complete len:533 (+) Transcript_34249:175-1773(+)
MSKSIGPPSYKPGVSGHFKEMMRIHELWGESKAQIRQMQREKDSIQRRHENEVSDLKEQHRVDTAELRDNLAVLRLENKNQETLIKTLQKENSIMRDACEDMHQQLKIAQDRVSAQNQTIKENHSRVREMDNALSDLEDQKKRDAEDLRHSKGLNAELKVLKEKLHEMDEASVANAEELLALKQNNNTLRQERDTYQSQLQILKETQEEVVRNKVELQKIRTQAEVDIKANREISLLRSQLSDAHDELRNFRHQISEEKHQNEVLQEKLSRAQGIQEHMAEIKNELKAIRSPTKNKAINEEVPIEVVSMIKEFSKSALGRTLQKHTFREFLARLNSIWYTKMQSRLQKDHRKHQAEIKELKRSMSQKLPYANVLQKAQIQRLKKEVTRSRHQLARCRPENEGLLELALASVDSLSIQLRSQKAERRKLKGKISQLLSQQQKGRLETAFLAGVRWTGDKALSGIEKLIKDFPEIVKPSCELIKDGFDVNAVEPKLCSEIQTRINVLKEFLEQTLDNAVRAIPLHVSTSRRAKG